MSPHADRVAKNARLIYGRMTGWGQTGPLSDSVGHDPNYIAVTGALHSIGNKEQPPPVPLNLVGDFGGGALYLAMGILAALLEASRSGEGQVVDAAIVDGVASMMTMFFGLKAGGLWTDKRQANLLDGAAPFGQNYETKDGGYIALCALEQRFYKALLEAMEITDIDVADQYKQELWPQHEEKFRQTISQKTRDEWADIFDGTDSCAAPVLTMSEAPEHPHSEARNSFVTVDGIKQPAPAPRFSRTASVIQHGPSEPGERDLDALSEWGLSESEISRLSKDGVLKSKSAA